VTDRIKEPWGERTPFGPGEAWPIRVDQFLEEGISVDEVDRWVQTASLHHANGDAIDLAVIGGRLVGVRGRAVDRVNRGRPRPFEARVGNIRVRSLSFSLDGDVDEAGHRFMRTVLEDAPVQA
jgi:hypothetical protein